jgi:hypothetical protein
MNPLELVDYLFGLFALAAGVGIGWWLRPSALKPLQPVCSCKHGYGHHVDGAQCAGFDLQYYDSIHHRHRCECRRYDGPDPLIFGLEPPTAGPGGKTLGGTP